MSATKPAPHGTDKAVDGIQQRLTDYAQAFRYEGLPADVVHAAKVRIIDTLGALLSGFSGEPCRLLRTLAARMPDERGATVIGTRWKTTPDMAAFVNGATVLHTEMTDVYHWPGSAGGHPSDVMAPLLACAEHVHANGRDLIAGLVLAYEIYLRFNDGFGNPGFDHTNFCCLATAISAARMLGLDREQTAHAISMAVIPNNALRVTRAGYQSLWKVGAAAQAGRAGIFAALLARAGMEGPHLPFEGKAGWCDHVALKRIDLDEMGGDGIRYKILDTSIKMRPASAFGVTAMIAAEQLAPLANPENVAEITVELYRKSKDNIGAHEYQWHPEIREVAAHSAPYLVATSLMEGALTARSFDEAHLRNSTVRALMQKVKVIENPAFTADFNRAPAVQRARVTVMSRSGERLIGVAGETPDDLATPKSDAQIEKKFSALSEEYLGATRVRSVLDRLWSLEQFEDAAVIAPQFEIA
jgi:2-methylcitrate dehydratase